MSQKNKQAPSNWTRYERGRTSSVGSLSSINEGEAQNEGLGSGSMPTAQRWFRGSDAQEDGEQNLRRRKSSVFNSLRQIGGVNNLDNFARSFQRAAAFRQITPVRRNSISHPYEDDDDEEEDNEGRDGQSHTMPNKSLLRQQFEAAQQQQESPEMAVTDGPSIHVQRETSETSPLLPSQNRGSFYNSGSFSVRSRLGAGPDALAELGTSFGSISSRLTDVAQKRATILIQQHIEASLKARETQEDGEEIKDDLIDREVEIETREDGEVIERIVGESTVPMTVFNSINVLIGIGILALPLAIRYCGWVLGMGFLLLPAILTNYTAKLLAKCLDTNSGSTTYGDLAFLAFGDVGRNCVEALFMLELASANVALLILFGDTMNSLIPSVGKLMWKTILALALTPLNFVPFKALSVTSVLGIGCTVGIVLLVLTDGIIKPQSPGSMREFMPTYAFPQDWRQVPLAVGLFAAPWGGHSVFPAIYKDMRHPQKYTKALRTTYIFVYGLDLTMAVFGYLMFGDLVRDEVTVNILTDKSYPKVVSVMIVVLIAIIPITKIPLSNRPITDTINKKFLIDLRQMDAKAREYSQKSVKHNLARISIGVAVNILELGLSVLIPDFDSIMATLGSSLCLTICVFLPIFFYLQIFSSDGKTISKVERIVDWILVVIVGIVAILGTVFALIPKEKLGIKACQGIACMG